MNRVTSLFGIRYPIIQGGMVWCSGWRLAAAVSNAGGLGLLGAGSMHPETLREHIRKCREATHHAFGVNIPLMYPQIEEIMQIVADEGVKIVFTSAGSPKKWTGWLHERGITVVHVVSSSRFAVKAEEAGVDAIVAEGFEAGGHNGREETTTLCLILRHSFYLNFSVPAFWMDCLIFLNLFTLLFFDVILIQRGHAAQTVYDRFNLLYNKINVLFCDLLT